MDSAVAETTTTKEPTTEKGDNEAESNGGAAKAYVVAVFFFVAPVCFFFFGGSTTHPNFLHCSDSAEKEYEFESDAPPSRKKQWVSVDKLFEEASQGNIVRVRHTSIS